MDIAIPSAPAYEMGLMYYLGAALVLVFCAPAVFVPAQKIRFILVIAVAALVIGAFGCLWPLAMPKNFLIENPWAVNSPLYPTLSIFYGGICLLFSVGLFLALGVRKLLVYLRILKLP